LRDADFRLIAFALDRARRQHLFPLTAWVFLSDHWNVIRAPVYLLAVPNDEEGLLS
jgi:hypothetical protein